MLKPSKHNQQRSCKILGGKDFAGGEARLGKKTYLEEVCLGPELYLSPFFLSLYPFILFYLFIWNYGKSNFFSWRSVHTQMMKKSIQRKASQLFSPSPWKRGCKIKPIDEEVKPKEVLSNNQGEHLHHVSL